MNLHRGVRQLATRALKRLGGRLNLDVLERTIYSPIPDVPPPDSQVWDRPATLAGCELDLTAQLELLEGRLAPYLAEFHPPREPTGRAGEFFLENGYYGPGDAEILYAMIRHLRPRRLLELGSGYSTIVSGLACARNEREGHPVEFTAADPEPGAGLVKRIPYPARLERRRAAELPLERYLELGPRDILFVDTTHTVKFGSEVNFLVLEVLPRLSRGVVVHFHDIFIPYEYPRAWLERGTYPAEQYLLHAFLIENPRYRVLLAVHALVRTHRERLVRLLPSLRGTAYHTAAFWMERVS